VVPDIISEENVQTSRQLAACMHTSGLDGALESNTTHFNSLAIMQLSHAGRQSPNIIGGRRLFVSPMAPSDVAVGARTKRKNRGILTTTLHRLLFQTPRPMSVADIEEVITAFVRGAQVAVKAGFDGVQLHIAHGCESCAAAMCSLIV